MSSRIELLNAGLLRSDGRRPYELRTLAINFAPQGTADGSVTYSHGLTQVRVSVLGPHEPKPGTRRETFHDRATLNVEVQLAPFGIGERRRRGRGDKRLLELAASIKSTFEPVVQTHLYPRSAIDIFVHVLQLDGGLLPACINASTLALAAAGIPLFDFVCAIGGGVHGTQPLLDLTTVEENDVPSVVVGVMPRTGRVTLVQMETRLHMDRFEEVFKVACDAGKVLWSEMRDALRERTGDLVDKLGAGPGMIVAKETEET
ncbi:exoribonuclease, exosome component 4 [Suillus fuscotomentosus]|uniref:Ribosomal RNA-processing protein 41 n=1 Tax=Suillus fuscotomentosus TaxID=1912939 RepID=A0AAD4EK65_9AGAM|nr:exoribonuclease, exosome component 4 [Suillus fuscotomentosus]KAG1907596.1 exoribonuclease, exosome component 4 [Suillus fuscotomentosus]